MSYNTQYGLKIIRLIKCVSFCRTLRDLEQSMICPIWGSRSLAVYNCSCVTGFAQLCLQESQRLTQCQCRRFYIVRDVDGEKETTSGDAIEELPSGKLT